MIIGINGKIGSGKDTVGKIIQWLTKPEPDGQYIGFQTYDDYTLEKLSPFKIKKFAGKLKQIASLLTGIDVGMYEDQDFKKLDMAPEWGMTYREFLQKLGTEAMREGLHTNVWVNALFADYKSFGKTFKDVSPVTGVVTFDTVGIHPNWIITDMRFPNEMEAVVKRNGITIRVVRDNPSVETLTKKDVIRTFNKLRHTEHPSETALDKAKFDYEIINDAGILELIKKVRQILITEKII